MSYLTIAELRDIVGERRLLLLADEDGDGVLGSEEIIRVEQAIADASGDIDSRVAMRYATPLASDRVTRIMLRHVANAAIYHLADTTHAVTDDIKSRYQLACDWAKEVGCGKVQLGVTADEPPQRIPAAKVTTPSATSLPQRTFSGSNMRGLG